MPSLFRFGRCPHPNSCVGQPSAFFGIRGVIGVAVADSRVGPAGHRVTVTASVLRASRIIWWVKPHSLSYQAITLTSVPSTTRVRSRSMIAARGSPTMSAETSGSSETPRMPSIAAGRRLLPERVVDLLRGGRPVRDEHDVGDRPHRDRRAHRDPVEPAGQLRYRAGGGSCRPGRGGHQVGRAGPATPEALAGTVDELLAGGVGVDGRHHRPLDPDHGGGRPR